jgi:two-component system chemotaxis response regulator CheB
LHAKRRRIALKKRGAAPAVPGPAPKQTLHAGSEIVLRQIPANFRPDCLAIGSSTGGPQALFKIFQMMGRMAPVPIFVTQHMPATFTTILADHLAQASGMPAAEAKDGEPVVQGRIYVAPGDYHMVVQVEGGRKIVRIEKSPPENYCRPAVDPMLRSIARAYGGRALVVILTGMGHDGREGAQKLVDAGGVVVAQDEPTSVVWGMPGAVATSKLCSAVLPLSDIAPFVRKTVLRTAA